MRVINRYDFDEKMEERYIETIFETGNSEQINTHGYSYLHCRTLYKEMGDTMGLEKEILK